MPLQACRAALLVQASAGTGLPAAKRRAFGVQMGVAIALVWLSALLWVPFCGFNRLQARKPESQKASQAPCCRLSGVFQHGCSWQYLSVAPCWLSLRNTAGVPEAQAS